jgi:hypothetical protein
MGSGTQISDSIMPQTCEGIMKRCRRCGEVLLQFEGFCSIISTVSNMRRHRDEEIVIGCALRIYGFEC